MGWALLLLVLLTSLPLLIVGWLGFQGRLPRNSLAGIRLPYTLSSDDRWKAAHRAAGPIFIFAGVAVLAGGLAFAPFVLAGAIPNGVSFAALLGVAAVVVGSVLAATVVGLRYARRTVG